MKHIEDYLISLSKNDYFLSSYNTECDNWSNSLGQSNSCICNFKLEWHDYPFVFPKTFYRGSRIYEVTAPGVEPRFKVYIFGGLKPYVQSTPIVWDDGTEWWNVKGIDNLNPYSKIKVVVSPRGCKWWFFNGRQVWGRPVYVPELDSVIGERYARTPEVQKQIEEATTARSAALKEQKRHEEYWRKKEEKKEVIYAWVFGILFAITPLYVFFFCD